MNRVHALTALSMALLLSACGGEGDATQTYGANPKLPDQQRGLLPSMKIAEPTAWAISSQPYRRASTSLRLPLT